MKEPTKYLAILDAAAKKKPAAARQFLPSMSMTPGVRTFALTLHAFSRLRVHAAGGLVVLIAITAISMFKPWGRPWTTLTKPPDSQFPPS